MVDNYDDCSGAGGWHSYYFSWLWFL